MKCPFCKPWVSDAVFAESQNFMAVYNIAPILPGHTLIVPKRHLGTILDLNDTELSEMMIFARKVTTVLLEVFHAEAFDWSVQDKAAAGQTIFHLHMHLVPRSEGDLKEPGDWYPEIKNNYRKILDSEKRKKLIPEEMKQIVSKLKGASGMGVF